MKKNILVKISGDLLQSKKAILEIVLMGRENHVVVICGGGTIINASFRLIGFEVKYDAFGRVCTTPEASALAKKILLEERTKLAPRITALACELEQDVDIVILPSFLESFGGVPCHVNSDVLLLAAHKGFDEVYAFTLKNRIEKKKQELGPVPNLTVVGF